MVIDVEMFPHRDLEDISWGFYGTTLSLALSELNSPERKNQINEEVVRERLSKLDSALKEIGESFPNLLPILVQYNPEEFPGKRDIASKCMEMVNFAFKKEGLDGNDYNAYCRFGINVLQDCRRVIRRLLNDEQTYLTPKQKKRFFDLTERLSYPPKDVFRRDSGCRHLVKDRDGTPGFEKGFSPISFA